MTLWNGNIFQVTGPLWGESTGDRCFLLTCNNTWWRHEMETFSSYWPFVKGIHRLPVDSPHKGQWRRASISSLMCAWKTVEQRVDMPVIWETMMFMSHHHNYTTNANSKCNFYVKCLGKCQISQGQTSTEFGIHNIEPWHWYEVRPLNLASGAWSSHHQYHPYFRTDFRFMPCQWEKSLHSNDVSHWLGASL